MKLLLLLLTTTLLFYTQATEEKKCIKEYVLTDKKQEYSESQNACKNLEGEMASEDLKDSENAKKAEAAVKTFRETDTNLIWLGIAVEDINEAPHETNNPFKFSDGTDVDDSNFIYKWEKNTMAGNHPVYKDEWRCTILAQSRETEVMATFNCDGVGVAFGLCKIYEKCKDENSASSESERSRANLPVFALFLACSVFKTFYALVGIVF